MKTAAIVGWSGRGRFEDLERTALRRLGAPQREADRVHDAILLDSEDPVAAARSLALMPGVSWIAAGYRFSGNSAYLESLRSLGRRYLTKTKRFRISAKAARSKETAGDLVLAGNSELLASVAGAKVDERRPQVRFRVCLEGARGACGVEIREGPGGAPTGGQLVACLVSGGARSSSMAWMAALSGYSVRLVHSRTDDTALRQVARLYSELSFRMDPNSLELLVLEGDGSPAGRIGRWLGDHRETSFAGVRPGRPEQISALAKEFPNLALPLVLAQEDAIAVVYRSLGLGPPADGAPRSGLTPKSLSAGGPYTQVRFGGVEADANAVIDALKRRA